MVKTLYDPEVERKGVVKGELKARRETVYSQVNKKLGSIPDHLAKHIDKAGHHTLSRILDDIFDINSFSDVESYFLPDN